MKFLVDAQLPKSFCAWLQEAGHEVMHSIDLPLGNRTPDSIILDIAEREYRIVVTKDDDFVQSHLITGRPEKLLLVATGNIGNSELKLLPRKNLVSIIQALDGGRFVEIDRETLTIHA